MPWKIAKSHPDCDKPFPVVKDDGKLVGCHATREKAAAQLAALNANVKERFELRLAEADQTPPQGNAWEVVIIGPEQETDIVRDDTSGEMFLMSKNKKLYALDALRNNAHMFEGAQIYDTHLSDEDFAKRAGNRSIVNELVGSLSKVKWDEAKKSIVGIFNVIDGVVREKLLKAQELGILRNLLGLSIDTNVIQDGELMVAGTQMPVFRGFSDVHSVDLVPTPAAGGRIERAIASIQPNHKENKMELQELLAKLGEVNLDELSEEEREALETQLATMRPAPVEEAKDEGGDDPAPEVEPVPDPEPQPEPVTQADLDALRVEMHLNSRLAEAGLPGYLVKMVKTGVKNANGNTSIKLVDELIKQAKEAQAAADTSGRVTEAAGGRATVGTNEDDNFFNEFLRLAMGNTAFKNLGKNQDEALQERLPESYRAWEAAGRQHGQYRRISELIYDLLGGDYFAMDRAAEAVTTSSMSSIVKNAMNIMLANDYSARQRWWEPIVRTEEVDTIDQATLVRVYGLANLAVVNEGAAYAEMAWADEEETAAFVKRGNYVGVTMETLLRDKISTIRTIPARLSNAWYNTLSGLVAGVFTVNSAAGPVLADTGALFNATAVTTVGGHANLLTTALGTTTAAYAAARLAMRKQTDQPLGTGNRLGIRPRYLLVPYDLEVAAQAIMKSATDPGAANDDVNVLQNESAVVGVPEWTNTTDWHLVADPAMWPAIWLIFHRGATVPSLFTSDSETAGAMFTNDTIRYKVRMLTYRFSSTYDCAPVSDFRPLHKNNVA